jgi:hypothetical protein
MVMHKVAGDIAQVIRLNPIPWLFAPGIALAGYAIDGTSGAARALAGWAALVTAATVWVILRRRFWPDKPDAGGP